MSAEARAVRRTLVRDSLDVPLVEKRAVWERHARGVPLPDGVDLVDERVGGVGCLRIVPRSSRVDDPLVLYLHGGGLVEGSAITARELTARLALATALPILSVDYRLAPEHPHPAALDDVCAVVDALRRDGVPVAALGADSSGCTLALQWLLRARDADERLPDCAFFLSPSVDLTFSGASMTANRERDPVVSPEVLEHCASLYAGSHDRASPSLSPLFAELDRLPPASILAAADEVLLDDAARLAARLGASGGRVVLDVREGLWHVWPAWPELPESAEALANVARFVRAHRTDGRVDARG